MKVLNWFLTIAAGLLGGNVNFLTSFFNEEFFARCLQSFIFGVIAVSVQLGKDYLSIRIKRKRKGRK